MTSNKWNWVTGSGYLDQIARYIELRSAVRGRPTIEGKAKITQWVKDPERKAIMEAVFAHRLAGPNGKASIVPEKFIWVADEDSDDCEVYALASRTRHVDAKYYSRPWIDKTTANSSFIEYGELFNLQRSAVLNVAPLAAASGDPGARSLSPEAKRELLRSCAVEVRMAYTGEGLTVTSIDVLPLIRPKFVGCLPLPASDGKLEWRCISSGTSWQAMISVARSLGGKRPPAVLVTGPPGSGKEAYARAVHYGQRRNSSESNPKSDIFTLSLAGATSKDLHAVLPEKLRDLQSNGGTLFLDEVDKAEPSARSYLLRILENRKFLDREDKEQDCGGVAFVIAAGSPLSELRGKSPPDFWTRMESHVAVGDPLTAGSQQEREEILAEFFYFFWWDWVSDWLGSHFAEEKPKLDARERDKLDFVAGPVFETAIGSFDATTYKFTKSVEVKRIAETFARVLAPHLERRQLSLRGLRSSVAAVQRATRAELASVALASANGLKDEALRSVRDALYLAADRAIYDAIGTVLQVIPDDARQSTESSSAASQRN